MIQCEFNIQLHGEHLSLDSILWLNLFECHPRSRDKALVMLESMETMHELYLWIKFYDHDSLSTVELLPKNISSLSIRFHGNSPLTLVPDIARWLKGLRRLRISGLPSGWSLRTSCIKDGLRFPGHIIIRGDIRTRDSAFCFSLSEGWTVMAESKHKIADVAPNWDFRELETELRWLCSLSPMLNEVSFFVSG
jgi:hypothetical protein